MILVTGGTGFVGQAVVRALTRAGHRVRVLVRNPKSKIALRLQRETHCELVSGDVLDAQSLQTAMQSTRAVVHLVGILFEWRGQTYQRLHVEATNNVVAAMQKAGVRRFVHMSALGTHAGARSQYHQTKWQAEELVRAGGLDWTIVRPSLIWGPRDHLTRLLGRGMRWPLDFLQLYTWPNLGGGLSRIQPIHVEDVAQAISRTLSATETIHKSVQLVGPEQLTWSQFLEKIARTQGHEFCFERLPWRTLGRATLWALLTATPLILLTAILLQIGTSSLWICTAATWCLALWIAKQRCKFIFYEVPFKWVRLLTKIADTLIPRWPFPPSFWSMLQEDNIADVAQTEHLLGHPPRAFIPPNI